MRNKRNLENKFAPTFTAILAQREKQIQQYYRPIIGIHKWFARRPGTVFRNLLLAEFNADEPIETSYWKAHEMQGVIADPFMGGGIPLLEANRLGFSVVGTDINPMAFWIVRQSLEPLSIEEFKKAGQRVVSDVEKEVKDFYTTNCNICGKLVPVKYFIWVKTKECPECNTNNDLFPGYLLAEATRHPHHVVACNHCGNLNEYENQPSLKNPGICKECGSKVYVQGVARKNKISCHKCGSIYPYPGMNPETPPKHRMWAIEYHCEHCKPEHNGRFFKKPDSKDLARFQKADNLLNKVGTKLPIPNNTIPEGDETLRLHRWGYTRFRDLFNRRQLLGLGLLLRRIIKEDNKQIRYSLLTVFSDFLRYQNMLCRYDTYALKCQDIFSVHGFPVGLVQCENNLLGIPRIGAGAYRHFIEKYIRAKEYCKKPFETRINKHKKETIYIDKECIKAELVNGFPHGKKREAYIKALPATEMRLPPNSLDAVYTDPPYFDNVQYAELMDFCYVWLRLALKSEFVEFKPSSTRRSAELTGNITMGRGLYEFTKGLSRIFCHYTEALKTGAPFVFTYHHNDPSAYVPLVVAILDAGLNCSATLPAPAEMGASLHIARSKSSVIDTVFVCRKGKLIEDGHTIEECVSKDIEYLNAAGLKITRGDINCLLAGQIARITINQLHSKWNFKLPLDEKMLKANDLVDTLCIENQVSSIISNIQENKQTNINPGELNAKAI